MGICMDRGDHERTEMGNGKRELIARTGFISGFGTHCCNEAGQNRLIAKRTKGDSEITHRDHSTTERGNTDRAEKKTPICCNACIDEHVEWTEKEVVLSTQKRDENPLGRMETRQNQHTSYCLPEE